MAGRRVDPARRSTPTRYVTPIEFNRPHTTGLEHRYMQEAIDNLHLSGNGPFSARCSKWLRESTGAKAALMTHSATGALEMAALLAGVKEGDEVVMPSFTFVSTANAFVLRGATPVFVDIRRDTLNLDESLIADALTPRTRAIVPVHYAGVSCDMDAIRLLAAERGLIVIEDASQGVSSTFKGAPLGGLGELAALSFHETKNVMCGEGGALLVNDERLIERAEVIQEKGTNRRKFFKGQVDKYTWVDLGSSFLMSELNAAFLWAQLQAADEIKRSRLRIWGAYHAGFEGLEAQGRLRRPIVPDECGHNAHMYYVILADADLRDPFIEGLAERGVRAVFHYVPLHESSAGRRFGRAEGPLPVTSSVSGRLVRLPLWVGMTAEEVEYVIASAGDTLSRLSATPRS
jgi:dTDP-4-amino-4,6-dideoxygalactose transaminase